MKKWPKRETSLFFREIRILQKLLETTASGLSYLRHQYGNFQGVSLKPLAKCPICLLPKLMNLPAPKGGAVLISFFFPAFKISCKYISLKEFQPEGWWQWILGNVVPRLPAHETKDGIKPGSGRYLSKRKRRENKEKQCYLLCIRYYDNSLYSFTSHKIVYY